MSHRTAKAAAVLLFCSSLCSFPAWADGDAGAAPLGPLCTDRPSKNTAPCTVDADHFQLEWDVADGSFQRRSGVTTDLWYTAPSLKYGLTGTWDIEATLPLYQNLRQHSAASTNTQDGIGDLVLASQWAFASGSVFSGGLRGFIKVPTADSSKGLGNGAWEGGVLLPMSITLDPVWSIATTPQVNVSLNSADQGRHAQFEDALGLSRSLPGGFSVAAELWTLQDFDPAKMSRQYSADLNTAWMSDNDTQFDASANFGLNKATPDLEITIGLSRRF